MESRYEILKDLKNKGTLTRLIGSGLMCLTIATRLEIYERYLKELKRNKKVIAIQNAANEYNISSNYVYKIIVFMNE